LYKFATFDFNARNTKSYMSNSFFDLPIATIEKALEIRKKIEALQASVAAILGGASDTPAATPVVKDRRKGKRSAAARAKMAAAQKARWAKKHAAAASPAAPAAKAPRKKRTMSPEAREKIAAAQRARWAKQKAA
jgi:hypothetical protein